MLCILATLYAKWRMKNVNIQMQMPRGAFDNPCDQKAHYHIHAQANAKRARRPHTQRNLHEYKETLIHEV